MLAVITLLAVITMLSVIKCIWRLVMINIDELYIVNYCHHNCFPLKNIVSLPEREAFSFAHDLAVRNPNTTVFFRFGEDKR